MNTLRKIANHLDEHEARWFAIYTRYKREKLIRKRLEDKGISTYLPIQQFVRHYARKIKVVDIPLINCYVFVKITKQEYVPVLETPDVLHFIKSANQLRAIPDEEIQVLKQIVGETKLVEVDKSSYQSGDEVEIIGGNLTGIKGILIDNQAKHNFLIELNEIGYTLRMQVDPTLLKRVSITKKRAVLGANRALRAQNAE